MKNLKHFGQLTIALMIVGTFIAMVVVLVNASGALDIVRAQQAARQAEAEAARLQAELELTRAQAEITRAEGEAAVLEAPARSVDADRRLVTRYTFRGDVRGVLALVGVLGLAICGAVIFIVVRGWRDAKNADNE